MTFETAKHRFSTDSYRLVIEGVVTDAGTCKAMHKGRKAAAKAGKKAFVGMGGPAIGLPWA